MAAAARAPAAAIEAPSPHPELTSAARVLSSRVLSSADQLRILRIAFQVLEIEKDAFTKVASGEVVVRRPPALALIRSNTLSILLPIDSSFVEEAFNDLPESLKDRIRDIPRTSAADIAAAVAIGVLSSEAPLGDDALQTIENLAFRICRDDVRKAILLSKTVASASKEAVSKIFLNMIFSAGRDYPSKKLVDMLCASDLFSRLPPTTQTLIRRATSFRPLVVAVAVGVAIAMVATPQAPART